MSDCLSQGHVNNMLTMFLPASLLQLIIFRIRVSSVLVFTFYESQAALLQNYAHIASRCLEMHPSHHHCSFTHLCNKHIQISTGFFENCLELLLFFVALFSSQFGMVCSHCTVVPVRGVGFISEVCGGSVYVCSALCIMLL